ncbi:MAG: hypothetical protein ACR2G2_19035 [Pseudonocardia sp.]
MNPTPPAPHRDQLYVERNVPVHNHTEVHLARPRLITSLHDRGYASAIAPAIDDMARRMLEAGAARRADSGLDLC